MLTQDYTGDAWGGFSNLSTGALTESMLNFGIIPGFICGLLLLFALFVAAGHMYRAVVAAPKTRPPLKALGSHIRYIFIVQFVAGMLLGEFANSVVNIILQLIILSGIMFFIHMLESHYVPARRQRIAHETNHAA